MNNHISIFYLSNRRQNLCLKSMATKNEHSTINGDYDNNDGYINDHAQHRIVSMVTAWGRATTATYHYYYLHIYG